MLLALEIKVWAKRRAEGLGDFLGLEESNDLDALLIEAGYY